jgi:hypothetical protein
MPSILPNKKSCRTRRPALDQDDLWFLFEAGKFYRDLAEAAAKLEDVARRFIAKEYNKKKKERKKEKKLERKREEAAWLSSDEEEKTNNQPF